MLSESSWSRIGGTIQLGQQRFREWLLFDSLFFRLSSSMVQLTVGSVLCLLNRPTAGLRFLTKLHRSATFEWTSRLVERYIRRAHDAGRSEASQSDLDVVYGEYFEKLSLNPHNRIFGEHPEKLLGSFVLVLKSPGDGERGVLLVKNTEVFPVFAKYFELPRIAEKYFVVLEPAWSGYCDLNILAFQRYEFPVFVESFEPRDSEFLRRVGGNFVPVPIASNWWVDHRVFCPHADVEKDTDVVMVAAWAGFKRHYRFFQALGKLRRQGKRLSTILIGYPLGSSKAEVLRQARWYGVEDQLEVHESVPSEEVARLIGRARVNVLWSRREGVNRSIVEGMFVDVPCIVREGFNYGYRYPYVNPLTGLFSSEAELPEKIVWALENCGQFAPRQWCMEHMSCQQATAILEEVVGRKSAHYGEKWTRGLSVKVNTLHSMRYWDSADEIGFREDYEFLKGLIRVNVSPC